MHDELSVLKLVTARLGPADSARVVEMFSDDFLCDADRIRRG